MQQIIDTINDEIKQSEKYLAQMDEPASESTPEYEQGYEDGLKFALRTILKSDKLTVLKNILRASNLIHYDPANYDFTLPGELDESGAGGVWDMAGDIQSELLPAGSECNGGNLDTEADQLQQLLYDLLSEFKNERGEQ